MKKFILLAMILSSSAAFSKPVLQVTEGVNAKISKTVIESWPLTDDEKKNTAIRMMSSLSATAIAPSGKIRRKEWTSVASQHKACFYNTYGATMSGKYSMTLDIAGQQATVFEVVPVGAGQAFCVTRYLQMWVNPPGAGSIQTKALTHVEMDGQASDNEGLGTLEVR